MKYVITFLFSGIAVLANAQKFVSGKSTVLFFSKAAIEDITAHNSKASSLIDTPSGDIAFVIPIADFEFAKSLMKEHFNEKYMETERLPKATFQGKLTGFDPKASGDQKATASGTMTIHGVAKQVEIPGTITVKNGTVDLHSKFMVKLADYNITIPTLLFRNIAEQVEVTVDFTYKPQ